MDPADVLQAEEAGIPSLIRPTLRILHAQHQSLTMLSLTLESIRQALGPDPFDSLPPSDAELADTVESTLDHLIKQLENVIHKSSDSVSERRIPAELWSKIKQLHKLSVRLYPELRSDPFVPSTLREVSQSLLEALEEEVPKPKFPREPLKNVLLACQQLRSVVCLADINRTIEQLRTMSDELEALHLILSAKQETEKHQGARVFRLWRVVKEALDRLKPAALLRSLELRPEVSRRATGLRVFAQPSDIDRAVMNILQNAVKYSYQLPSESSSNAWITIRLGESIDKEQVILEIESWGTPVTTQEIDEGLLFQPGYRGSHAGRGGQPGTGIGLYDARVTARRWGGDVTITSVPVEKPGRERNTTTVYLQLPVSKVRP